MAKPFSIVGSQSQAGASALIQLLGSNLLGSIATALGSTASEAIKSLTKEGKLPTVTEDARTFLFCLIGGFVGGTAGDELKDIFPEDIAEAAENLSKAYRGFLQRASLPGNEPLLIGSAVLNEVMPYVLKVGSFIVANGQQIGNVLGKGFDKGIDAFSKLIDGLTKVSSEGGES